MVIPSSLKVLAHRYKVIIDNEMMSEGPNVGSCCSNLLRIRIADGIPESAMADTLLHEIFEALKYQMELELDHNVLSSLTSGLLAVIRDNGLDFRENQ